MRFDAYIVHCNCSEYAIMVTSVTAATGEKFAYIKLFSKYMYSVKKNKLEHVS